MDCICRYDSPLGGITIAGDGPELVRLWFDGQKYFSGTLEPMQTGTPTPVLLETIRWLDIYFSGREPDFTPPLRMNTTAFRKRVWEILLTIPYGKTVTYAQIAEQIAAERGIPQMSAQAVGGAVGHNSIALIIPCHRVIGSDGSLTGYAGGLDRKLSLLKLESADAARQHVPKSGTAR